MTDFQPHAQSTFVVELQRLVNVHRDALRVKDQAAIEDAAHNLKTYLYLNGSGRLAEWFNSRQESK